MYPGLILASQSPRRQELLSQVGINYHVLPVDIDETPLENESPGNYVKRLAMEKARHGCILAEKKLPDARSCPVLGADTAVVIDQQILGKPRDKQEAIDMLNKLSGRTHQVMTAIVFARKCENSTSIELLEAVNVSEVTFKALSEAEISDYWDTGECLDKAGAYAIQGRGAAFIQNLNGSYSGVMGLPIFETLQLLQQLEK